MPRALSALPPLLALAAAVPALAASISGVCPDGSIFIVQDRARIPCPAAKEVDPNEMPPMRPEYLSRPYAWQVYREGANPNNPYNLIDAARRVRELRGQLPDAAAPGASAGVAPGSAFGAAPPGLAGASNGAALPPAWTTRPAREQPTLALAEDDVRDLFLIVELSQRAAPARFVKEDVQGEAALEVSFAWSGAFEERFRAAAPRTSGAVVLFTVLAHQADAFHPNFTFVQQHETFSPSADDPAQLGFLEGQPGPLPAEGVALGYVVLPARMDPGAAFDLYWNDRRIETRLRP